jgi:alkylhydroperoxidase family enzyme
MEQQTPLLQPTPPAAEQGRVAAIFSAIEQRMGGVPDGLRLYGLSPHLLETFVSSVGYFVEHPTISNRLLGFVRYLASAQVNCKFCVDYNQAFLISLGVDLADIQAARTNIDAAPLEEREKPLLALALKAVNTPEAVDSSDIAAAHAQGWSDSDIFDVVAGAAMNRSFNTVLKTFNVDSQGVFA